MRVFIPIILSLLALSSSVSSEVSTPANVVCYQEIVGSNSDFATVSSSIASWAANLKSSLGLSGDVHQYVDWAQVPDRNSFENGCDGPFATVADVFVHIQATGDNFDTISAALESFISSNPWTSQTNIACGARSVVTFLPGCGKVPATAAPTRGSNPTQPGTSSPTRANNPTQAPGPSNVVCYQTIVGSSGTQAQVEASISAWAGLLETALGLSGDVHQYVDWSLVPDRTSFENDCNGPFATVEDVFVHIQVSAGNFDSVSAALEAFIAAHPITNQANIACAARSVTTFLPTCGPSSGGNPTQPAPTTQAPTRANNPTQAPTTHAPTQPTTSAPTRANNPTQAPTTKAPTTSAPTRANNPTQAPNPSSVVCYQAVVGSSGTQTQVEASISSWASLLQTSLGLSGDVHQFVDWSLVPDRTSFENGCNGPYATVEDVFVHIQTSSGNFDSVSAALEAFIAAHPIANQANIACAARSVTDFLPTCGKGPSGANPTQSLPTRGNSPTAPTQNATIAPTKAATSAPTSNATSAPTFPPRGNSSTSGQPQPTPNNILCYQEIIGSNSDYASVSASVGAWASKLESALGLSGDVHLYIDWAQVKDRVSFENGCNGPYTTVADVFVHVDTTSQAYDDLSSKLEAFVSANPWTSQPNVACGARSIVTYIPGCGKVPIGPSSVTTAPPTSGPTSSTTAPTSAPTNPSTSAPTNPATQAPTSGPTNPTTSAPTTAAPTTAPTSSPTPTPANVVCYQSVIASNASYTTLTVDIETWANNLQSALGLSGDIHKLVDWAQVTDRTSFETCPGPYVTIADVFVHIPTTSADYDAVSLKLENFVLSNPLTGQRDIVCAARSVTTFLPTCGKAPGRGGATPGGSGTVCYQSIVGSLTGTYAQVSSEFSSWAQKLYNTLGLTGPIENSINFAQVPDRNSFENGCNGPYSTVADLFVHISTTSSNYATVAANVESFVASNPLVSSSTGGVINCAARSVTSNIPICGNSLISSQSEISSPQTTANGAAGTITITTSMIITLIASTLFFIKL